MASRSSVGQVVPVGLFGLQKKRRPAPPAASSIRQIEAEGFVDRDLTHGKAEVGGGPRAGLERGRPGDEGAMGVDEGGNHRAEQFARTRGEEDVLPGHPMKLRHRARQIADVRRVPIPEAESCPSPPS